MESHFYHQSVACLHSGDPLTLALPLMCLPLLPESQYMQKKSPLYSQLKEDTVWSMESFNAYVNDRFHVARGLPRDWVLGAFTVSAAVPRCSSQGPITSVMIVVGLCS